MQGLGYTELPNWVTCKHDLKHLQGFQELSYDVDCAEASGQFQLVPSALEQEMFQVQLPNGCSANIRIPDSWPEAGADLALLSLHSADGPLATKDVATTAAQITASSKTSLVAFLHALAATV